MDEQETFSPVVQTIRNRAAGISDDLKLGLSIEGGGMAGCIPAGMCLVLERLGFTTLFDTVYGVSAGALNGLFFAPGRVDDGLAEYERALLGDLRKFSNLLRGAPVLNLDDLFDVIMKDKELYLEGFASKPELKVIVTDIESATARLVENFSTLDDLISAVKFSCSIPYVTGKAKLYEGRETVDGGIVEAIPYASALADGVDQLLVLRSRPASWRREESAYINNIPDSILRRGRSRSKLGSIMLDAPARYNRVANELGAIAPGEAQYDRVAQICIDGDDPIVDGYERSLINIRAGMDAGVRACSRLFGDEQRLQWAPELVDV